MKSCEKHGYILFNNGTCPKCGVENKHFTVNNAGWGKITVSNTGGGSNNANSVNSGRTGYIGGGGETVANYVIKPTSNTKRDHRNDLAKEAMKLIMAKSPFVVSVNGNKDWVFKAVADGAYAYADAMLAASGDYDDIR